jgi:hypothetical protein
VQSVCVVLFFAYRPSEQKLQNPVWFLCPLPPLPIHVHMQSVTHPFCHSPHHVYVCGWKTKSKPSFLSVVVRPLQTLPVLSFLTATRGQLCGVCTRTDRCRLFLKLVEAPSLAPTKVVQGFSRHWRLPGHTSLTQTTTTHHREHPKMLFSHRRLGLHPHELTKCKRIRIEYSNGNILGIKPRLCRTYVDVRDVTWHTITPSSTKHT